METQRQIDELTQRIQILEEMLAKDNFNANQYFRKNCTFVGYVGFFNKTPVAQQSAITTPSGGGSSSADAVDQTARTAIGQIKTALQNLGLTA